MKRWFIAAILLAMSVPAGAQISFEDATGQAESWVLAHSDVILDRIAACLSEGDPRLCHTGWAASVTPNTDPLDSALATVTLDDPGRFLTTPCGSCFDSSRGTFAEAGIAIPATAPLNAKINIANLNGVWGIQLAIRIRYDGVLLERAWGRGLLTNEPWHVVDE